MIENEGHVLAIPEGLAGDCKHVISIEKTYYKSDGLMEHMSMKLPFNRGRKQRMNDDNKHDYDLNVEGNDTEGVVESH
jgi:hypothetical protein